MSLNYIINTVPFKCRDSRNIYFNQLLLIYSATCQAVGDIFAAGYAHKMLLHYCKFFKFMFPIGT